MSAYILPDLDYDFSALEPHISGTIVELHHGKHHAAYVKNANMTLDQLTAARVHDDYTQLAGLEKALAFNLSGHILHSLMWKNLAAPSAVSPSDDLSKAISKDFSSFDHFRRQILAAAGSIMGSGWAALVYEPTAKCLLVTQIYDHQANLSLGSVPLLVIDAWEHAYYLQYHNDKALYLEAVWKVINWTDINARYDLARQIAVPTLTAMIAAAATSVECQSSQ